MSTTMLCNLFTLHTCLGARPRMLLMSSTKWNGKIGSASKWLTDFACTTLPNLSSLPLHSLLARSFGGSSTPLAWTHCTWHQFLFRSGVSLDWWTNVESCLVKTSASGFKVAVTLHASCWLTGAEHNDKGQCQSVSVLNQWYNNNMEYIKSNEEK